MLRIAGSEISPARGNVSFAPAAESVVNCNRNASGVAACIATSCVSVQATTETPVKCWPAGVSDRVGEAYPPLKSGASELLPPSNWGEATGSAGASMYGIVPALSSGGWPSGRG